MKIATNDKCISVRKGRALTGVLRHNSPLLYATVSRAGAGMSRAAVLVLLTRLSATQQLRAINPALEVPRLITTRRRSHSLACSVPLTLSAFLVFLQSFKHHQSAWSRGTERERREREGKEEGLPTVERCSFSPAHPEKPSIMNRGSCLSCTPVNHFDWPTQSCLIWDFSHGSQHEVKLVFQIAAAGDGQQERRTLNKAVSKSEWQKRQVIVRTKLNVALAEMEKVYYLWYICFIKVLFRSLIILLYMYSILQYY